VLGVKQGLVGALAGERHGQCSCLVLLRCVLVDAQREPDVLALYI
jgi:hypothetical protein